MMEVCESVSVSLPDCVPPRTHLAEELLVVGKVVETGLEACEPGELRRHCVLQDQSLGGDVVMQGGVVVAATDTMVVVVDVAVGMCVLRREWRDGVAKRRGHWCGAYGGARDGTRGRWMMDEIERGRCMLMVDESRLKEEGTRTWTRRAMGSALSTCDERVGAVRATGAGDAGQWRLTRLSGRKR
jgi:hypothetical protein